MENNIENNKNYSTSSISLGINIGASKTLYSTCGIIEGRFKTHVLLSDVSKRVFPSQICYSDSHRLYGDTASALMKKFKDSSYFNLSRLIGFDDSVQFYQEELNNFFSYGFYNRESKKFKGCPTLNEEITSTNIIADYLSLINQFFFEKQINKEENVSYDYTTISVPDYFTEDHKQELKLICEAIGMKDVRIINESSAITMYYGYTKYSDLFGNGNKIDPTIEKNILFIDIGYSKTSFILSKFTKSNFEVVDIDNIIFLGGRDFNNKIYKHLLENFQKENNIELKENGRLKLRLMESIEKARKNLTCNKEINIYIESFYEDYDLNYLLKKEEFEKLIEEELIIFKTRFQKFWNKFKQKNKLYKIEIAGQLMRTPILQNIVFELTQIPISKTIIIDECLSIGAFYYAVFSCEKKQFEKVQLINSYNMYTINYSIENSQKYPFILKGELIPNKNKIFLGDILNISNKDEITIDFDYDENDIQDIGFKDYNICSFTIDIFNLKKKAENQKKFFLEYEIHEDNSFDIQLFYKNNNNKNIYLNQYLKRKEKGLFLNQNEKDKILEEFTKNENEFGSIDDNFDKFLTKKKMK